MMKEMQMMRSMSWMGKTWPANVSFLSFHAVARVNVVGIDMVIEIAIVMDGVDEIMVEVVEVTTGKSSF